MTDHLPGLRDRVWTRNLVVLDFDGPITRLLPGDEYLRVSAGARDLATALGVEVADEPDQPDHVQLLRHVAEHDPGAGRRLEGWCTEQEVDAAGWARPHPGAIAFAAECAARAIPLVVVTNNAPAAVAAVLAHGGPALTGLPVYGRDPHRLDRLKPSPAMLLAAARSAGVRPAAAVMVGDTAADVRAAASAGMPCVGLHEDPERRAQLLDAGAAGTVASLADLLPTDVLSDESYRPGKDASV